jgi:ribosome-binding protein aMBF1 (putative translation factor)
LTDKESIEGEMGVSKTNRSASVAAQEALPSKAGSDFKKALKSASDKKTAQELKASAHAGSSKTRLGVEARTEERLSDKVADRPADGIEDKDLGARLSGEELSDDMSSTEKTIERARTDEAATDSQRELDEVSLDDAFSDEDALDEEPMISVDGSWGSPAQGLAQPGAIVTPTPAPAPPAQVMQHLVSAMAAEGWVGADIDGKKVVMLNVECPGRGSVRIRLRKEESGVSVRVRADNDELTALLETHQDQLRDAMSKKGLSLANLEVVS